MRFNCIFVLIVLLCSSASAILIDGIAAIVNDDVITKSELYSIGKLGLHLYGQRQQDDLLQERINHHLILQQMIKQPPVIISEDEVESAIEAFVQKQDGVSNLQQFLGSIGMNYSDFEKEVRDQISIRKFIAERFRPFVNITIEEVEKYYNEVFKQDQERMGEEVPPFAESFEEIQILLVESQVQGRIKDWMKEIRQSATINIKE